MKSEKFGWGNMKDQEGVCWRCGQENHVAKNCIANMPEDIKQKAIDHTNLANINSNKVALNNELFAFVSTAFGSRKQGKLKPRWEEFGNMFILIIILFAHSFHYVHS